MGAPIPTEPKLTSVIKGGTGKISDITTKEIIAQIKDIEDALCELSKEGINGEDMEKSN